MQLSNNYTLYGRLANLWHTLQSTLNVIITYVVEFCSLVLCVRDAHIVNGFSVYITVYSTEYITIQYILRVRILQLITLSLPRLWCTFTSML